ncbi:hypothetical protein PsYK624_005580 [Phanerochaete sordida]|uniref:Uncharacterized protein n=1 Tax=Phanerochaete sordida TaxID=48140 RepID=A0A9P3FXU4_9APHY|nr:hypothetical protein PsYK624_005580 [Phanerochaete sordida]
MPHAGSSASRAASGSASAPNGLASEWARYSAFKRALKDDDPDCSPPTLQEWRELTGGAPAPPTAQPASRRDAPAIDPALAEQDKGQRPSKRRAKEKEAAHRPRRRRRRQATPESSDADEPDDGPRLILMAPGAELSQKQEVVKGELQTDVGIQMYNSTGLAKNPFIMKRGGAEPPTPKTGDGLLEVDWDAEVCHPTNMKVVDHVTKLVVDKQTNRDTWTISHKDVNFTVSDVREMVKGRIRSWQTSYRQKKNPARAAKRFDNRDKGRRTARQREKKVRRKKACGHFEKKHGVNPRKLISTPNMSEEISTFSGDDPGTRDPQLYTAAAEQCRLTEEEIQAGVKILERRSFTWQTQRYQAIVAELDFLHDEHFKSDAPAAIKTLKRVDLGRFSRKTVPKGKVYPVMISRKYKAKAKQDGTWAQVNMVKKDPEGFGPDNLPLSDDEGEAGGASDRGGAEGGDEGDGDDEPQGGGDADVEDSGEVSD